MILDKLVVGFNEVNCYILADEESLETIVIDPGSDASRIISHIEKHSYKVKYIILTHGHGDHIGGVDTLRNHTGAKAYIHMSDEEMLVDPDLNYSSSMPTSSISLKNCTTFTDSDSFKIGKKKIKIIHTPGHTQGSCCFYIPSENILISGDSLFYGSIGRTDLYGGDSKTLIHSLKSKILALPDDTKVYPGHGASTSIAFERRKNIFLQG